MGYRFHLGFIILPQYAFVQQKLLCQTLFEPLHERVKFIFAFADEFSAPGNPNTIS